MRYPASGHTDAAPLAPPERVAQRLLRLLLRLLLLRRLLVLGRLLLRRLLLVRLLRRLLLVWTTSSPGPPWLGHSCAAPLAPHQRVAQRLLRVWPAAQVPVPV